MTLRSGTRGAEAALEEAELDNPIYRDVSLNGVTALALPVRLDLGGAAIEVEFLDSESGERLAAAVDRKAGSRMKAWQGF